MKNKTQHFSLLHLAFAIWCFTISLSFDIRNSNLSKSVFYKYHKNSTLTVALVLCFRIFLKHRVTNIHMAFESHALIDDKKARNSNRQWQIDIHH